MSDCLINIIRNTIPSLNNMPIIVGVSGGVDSVVLIHALHQTGIECVVAHCNFHLRGSDSNEDENFVRAFSKTLNYPIETIDFDTVEYANCNGISIEMAARELRYAWFEELCEKYNSNYIAVAHNANDAVETFFLNLLRGTGIRGIVGMPTLRDKILRPLIKVKRKEIEAYAKVNNLQWQTDYTNAETVYLRNNIRHNIIPCFENINPSFLDTMCQNMSNFKDVENIFHFYSEQAKVECLSSANGRITIDVLRLKKIQGFRSLLFDWLNNFNIKAKLISQIADNIDMPTGKFFQDDTHIILKDRNNLLVEKIKPIDSTVHNIFIETTSIDYPISLDFQSINMPIDIIKDNNIAFLDADKLSFPLQLRVWRKGDKFTPYRMKGQKKLSDFFTNIKLNALDKKCTYVLCSKEAIVWVVGHRIDNEFAVTSNTKHSLMIKFKQKI